MALTQIGVSCEDSAIKCGRDRQVLQRRHSAGVATRPRSANDESVSSSANAALQGQHTASRLSRCQAMRRIENANCSERNANLKFRRRNSSMRQTETQHRNHSPGNIPPTDRRTKKVSFPASGPKLDAAAPNRRPPAGRRQHDNNHELAQRTSPQTVHFVTVSGGLQSTR